MCLCFEIYVSNGVDSARFKSALPNAEATYSVRNRIADLGGSLSGCGRAACCFEPHHDLKQFSRCQRRKTGCGRNSGASGKIRRRTSGIRRAISSGVPCGDRSIR